MPPPRIRVGVQLMPQHADYAAIREAVVAAEELGADVIFTWDHFWPLRPPHDGAHFEAWTMLAAWAETTTRVELGVLVSSVGYRNPDLLADMARTVDHVNAGRLVLGLGAGFRESEYAAYGYDFGSPGARAAALAQALPRIKHRWALSHPAPTRHIPMLVGGGGERTTLRSVAEHADIWHTFADGSELAAKVAVLNRHCADVGRDPAQIERSAFVPTIPLTRPTRCALPASDCSC